MILFDLKCTNEHTFEAWFQNSESYDTQMQHHLVACPICGVTDVSKAPMAPKLLTVSEDNVTQEEHAVALTERSANVPAQITEMLQKLRTELERSYENVGEKFAEEARKIHYGEAEQRNIYGKTTVEEVKKLQEEGIDLIPLPIILERNS